MLNLLLPNLIVNNACLLLTYVYPQSMEMSRIFSYYLTAKIPWNQWFTITVITVIFTIFTEKAKINIISVKSTFLLKKLQTDDFTENISTRSSFLVLFRNMFLQKMVKKSEKLNLTLNVFNKSVSLCQKKLNSSAKIALM